MLLSAKNIQLSYDDQKVIHDVSFEIGKGEIHCFLGESGCGKTTILKAIRGLMDFDQGEIHYQGEKVFNKSEKLVPGTPGISIVFQDFQLERGLTVFNNIKHHLIRYKQDYQIAKTEELIDLCGLNALKDKFPKELSGGQKQKVALAKALIEEPPLLLLDEPFSNLDNISKREFKQILKNVVAKKNISLLFVTHDSKDALSFSDTIWILQKGKILQSGSPKQLITQPKNTYAALLLGLSNILSGKNLQSICKEKLDPTSNYWVPFSHVNIISGGNYSKVDEQFYGDETATVFMINDQELIYTSHKSLEGNNFSIEINKPISLDY